MPFSTMNNDNNNMNRHPNLFRTFAESPGLQSLYAVARIECSRVRLLDTTGEWTENPAIVAGWQSREDAYTTARTVKGLVIYVSRYERPPTSGNPLEGTHGDYL